VINRIGEALKTLEQIRSDTSPQEQEAIDRILAVARELASDTGTAIEYLNENRNHPQRLEYQDDLKSSVDAATRLATLINGFAQSGKKSALVSGHAHTQEERDKREDRC